MNAKSSAAMLGDASETRRPMASSFEMRRTKVALAGWLIVAVYRNIIHQSCAIQPIHYRGG